MARKQSISIRLSPELLHQVDEYARSRKWVSVSANQQGGDHQGRDFGRTALIEYVLEALVENRLTVKPRASQSPFPVEETAAGTSPHFPLLIYVPPGKR